MATRFVPFAEIYPHLRAAILSHSRILRLGAMRLMSSKLIAAPAGLHEIMKRCLQGEEVPCDVQGSRERVLRIGRVVQVVGDAEAADFCARWLIGTLQIRFTLHIILTVNLIFSSIESKFEAALVSCCCRPGSFVTTIWRCCLGSHILRNPTRRGQ